MARLFYRFRFGIHAEALFRLRGREARFRSREAEQLRLMQFELIRLGGMC